MKKTIILFSALSLLSTSMLASAYVAGNEKNVVVSMRVPANINITQLKIQNADQKDWSDHSFSYSTTGRTVTINARFELSVDPDKNYCTPIIVDKPDHDPSFTSKNCHGLLALMNMNIKNENPPFGNKFRIEINLTK